MSEILYSQMTILERLIVKNDMFLLHFKGGHGTVLSSFNHTQFNICYEYQFFINDTKISGQQFNSFKMA